MRLAAVTITAILAAGAAYAQVPAAPVAVPEVMPFDIPYGQPIGLDLANKAIAAAEVEARKHNWKMSISVVGPAGILVAHATMDGTQYASAELSQVKARTSAQYRRATSAFQNGINSGGMPAQISLLAATGGVASEGGFPIVLDGKLIGAIGASGGLSAQDAVTARAGLDAITGK
jgi:uncharacterized protein GlcG (DUF336 family)